MYSPPVMPKSGGGKLLHAMRIAPVLPAFPLWLAACLAALLVFSILTMSGCAEDESPLVFEEGPRGDPLISPETLRVGSATADVEIRPRRTTGTALSLLVGADSRMEARGLIRFETIPDTSGARSAYLRLNLKRGRGEELLLAVRRVIGASDAWTPDGVTFDTAPRVDPNPVADSITVPTAAVPDSLPARLEVPIPFSLLRFWREFPDSNAGIEIGLSAPGAGQGIARVVSHNDVIFDETGVIIPTPALVLRDSTDADLRGVLASGDAYVVNDLRPDPTGADSVALVSAGAPSRFVLRFDLSGLPPGASVVRGILRLAIPPGQISSTDEARLAAYEVTEAWEENAVSDSLATASSATYIHTFDQDADFLELEIGGLAQTWSDPAENQGVLVRFADETAEARELQVFTRESPDPPVLTLIYLLPLGDRWEKRP